jgi:hypothetical protein
VMAKSNGMSKCLVVVAKRQFHGVSSNSSNSILLADAAAPAAGDKKGVDKPKYRPPIPGTFKCF